VALVSVSFFFSCSSRLEGDLKVFNDSDTTIFVKYCESKSDQPCDTVILIIEKGTSALLKSFSGKSNPQSFNCCPCQTNIFQVKSAYGKIKKDPNNKDSWTIPNKSSLKRYNSDAVKCELHVEKSDL
jgi:hypothetical protein